MTVEKAIELLTQTFVVKEEFVQDLIRDALRELGDVDMLITESRQQQVKINAKFLDELTAIRVRLCKLEGDGR